MLERPFTFIRNIFKKENQQDRELMKFVFEKSDGITLWIIGFSIGTVAALSTQITDLYKLFSVSETKTIFLFLFISIFCGVFYRIIYLSYYVFIDRAFRQIDLSLSESNMVDIEADLDGTESFEALLRRNSEYNKLPDFLDLYNKTDEKQKAELYTYMVDQYKWEAQYAKLEFDLAIETVEEAYIAALGKKLNLAELFKVPSNRPVKTIKFLGKVSIILYITFIISFLIAVGYLLYTVRIPIS